jgi:hypothetical protein
MRAPPGYHDLLEDLERPGCPVCRTAAGTARKLIATTLWESVNDPGARARWRASHGFCQDHALLLLQMARTDGQAIALLYRDLLAHIRAEAAEAAGARRRWWRRAQDPVLASHAPCGVCEAVHNRADTYLALLARADEDDDLGRAARKPGRALCVPHLRRGLATLRSAAARQRLLAVYERAHAELDAELEEYLRKQDTRFADEPRGAEQSSWRRAFLRAVGLPHHTIDIDPDAHDR